MLHGIQVVVVVPAYDEAPRIGRVLRGIPPFVDRVVVVDDGSRDATADTAMKASAGCAVPVEVVIQPTNRGVGAAIVAGYRRASERVSAERAAFVVMAGDDQMDPRDIASLVEPIAAGKADYVKGNRFAWPGVRSTMPLGRWFGGWVFSLATSVAIGQHIHDSQCGFAALASEAVARLDLDGLWAGYGYPNDLLGQLAQRGMLIAEVPVRPVYADEVSRLRVKHLPTIGAIVARAWVRRAVSRRA